jgi:hypothetical protein
MFNFYLMIKQIIIKHMTVFNFLNKIMAGDKKKET